MWVGGQGKTGQLSVIADRKPCGFTAKRAAPLADKESVGLRLHLRADRKPCLGDFDFIGSYRVRGGKAFFKPRHVQNAAFDVHAGKLKPAGLRHAQTVAEHHKEQATVAGLVAVALGRG